jgi:type II secretory pathway pseudopilin PulG
MRIYPHNLLADAKEERRQGERAFTMVEIAIAIGVIGFALVAVIGILPTGMNAQKDNREDTVISQDAPIFLDAIRNGGTNFYNENFPPLEGLNFLSNYIEKIMIISNYPGTSGNVITETTATFTNFGSGWEIVGLLSTPEPLNVSPSNYIITRAIVRSLSGAAVQQNGANQATSFRYQMDVEIVPYVSVAPDQTNYNYYTYGTPDYIIRSNRWMEVNISATNSNVGAINMTLTPGSLVYNMFDVKLRFSWPVYPGPNGTELVGSGRQTYRTTVSSGILYGVAANNITQTVVPASGTSQQLWFFQPQSFASHQTIQ